MAKTKFKVNDCVMTISIYHFPKWKRRKVYNLKYGKVIDLIRRGNLIYYRVKFINKNNTVNEERISFRSYELRRYNTDCGSCKERFICLTTL